MALVGGVAEVLNLGQSELTGSENNNNNMADGYPKGEAKLIADKAICFRPGLPDRPCKGVLDSTLARTLQAGCRTIQCILIH